MKPWFVSLFVIALFAVSFSFLGEKKIVSSERKNREINFIELRLDYVKRLNYALNNIIEGGSEFPLHDMFQMHKDKMLALNKKGYSSEFYEKIFKEWFLDRFGIDLEFDQIYKVGETYNLRVKKFKSAKLIFYEDNTRVQFFVDREGKEESIHLRPNIIFPKAKNSRYNFIYKEDHPIQIIPVSHRLK